jgi:hypothetical protein
MNGVDRNDRDSADYTTSIRINRWYLRIFFWVLDRVIFSCYIIAVYLAASGLKPAWNKYRSQLTGRYDQVDLLSLITVLAGLKAPYDEADKPKWMRQKKVIPCRCGVCFFCVEGKTSVSFPPLKRCATGKSSRCSTETKLPEEPKTL